MSIEFLITTLVVVISPGTGALYTIAAGLSRGGKASMWAAAVRGHVISRPSIMVCMRRTFAGAFVLLGVRLALTER